MRRLVLNTGAALGLGCLALAGAAPAPAAAQSTSTQQCGIQQAADLAVQRQLTLIDAAKTNTSEFFSGANACIANELLSSIDLSTLIPDLSGFLTSAATTTITKLIDAAKKKVCDIVNQQINNVISQINNKLYQFQSSITGDLSSLIAGLLLADQNAEHRQLRNADPRPAEHRLWRRVHARQPAPTAGYHGDVHRHDGWDRRIPDGSDHRRHHVDRPRLGPAPLRTVRPMTRLVLILPALTIASIVPAAAQTCLQVDVIERAGEAVSSPYGVDRTGRASAGFHQGLDLVNTARQSGAVTSGLAGTVVGKLAPRGGVNLVEVTTGNMKYQYMHLEHIEPQAAENPTVTAGQKLGMMGRAGASAVHLHLGALLSGQALQSHTGGGRFWLQQRGSKGSPPLTADQIKSAAPQAWYYVNPEPFLTHQVPYQSGASSYDQPGGARTVTLPRTCSPAEAIAARAGMRRSSRRDKAGRSDQRGRQRIEPRHHRGARQRPGRVGRAERRAGEPSAAGRAARDRPRRRHRADGPPALLSGELDSSLAHLALIVATAPAAPQPAPQDRRHDPLEHRRPARRDIPPLRPVCSGRCAPESEACRYGSAATPSPRVRTRSSRPWRRPTTSTSSSPGDPTEGRGSLRPWRRQELHVEQLPRPGRARARSRPSKSPR